ncbi:MAG TPA: PHP domain-containing protein, partial [Nitrospiria bacterium]|nr:PHP domain-containing protein [Nitrospiria bacterium]
MNHPFVHLHFHTTYSLLEASVQIDDAFSFAAENGMTSLAITDYGNLFGAVEFYFKAKKKGIKPIIGCEVYVAPGSRLNKEQARHAAPYHHLVLLAENQTGYRNLLKLISLAHVEGFYFKPRIDKQLLAENAEGLIGLSGTLRGEIPYLLERNQRENALKAATEYRDILGKNNFFIELWESGFPEQKKMNADLLEISKEAGLSPVATNDVHFLREEDALVVDILHCLAHGKTIDQLGAGARRHGQFYFKTGEEMARQFQEVPEAISNTAVIAERCQVKLASGETFLPQYTVPEGFSRDSYLADLARKGLEKRLERIDLEKWEFYRNRLEEELAMLVKMGYAGYFLIVWDII